MFGYIPSSGNLNVKAFQTSNTLLKLASPAQDEYIIKEYTPISNQGSLGSCVGNATADAFEILLGLEDPNNVSQLSRLFIYWNARVYDGNSLKDSGCYIHNALDSLKRLGVCSENAWPYLESKVFSQPNIFAYKEGNDNKIEDFYEIQTYGDERLNQIILALKANHPVIFGTHVDSALQTYQGGVVNPPDNPEGGHALIITGFRTNDKGQREFYIRNSWGSNWGENGHAWFSSSYITSSMTSDLFVPTRMNNLLL